MWRNFLMFLVICALKKRACSKQSGPERTYDRSSSTFSPMGRLYQVDYARSAVSKSKPCVGIVCDEGILLCGLKRHHQLQDKNFNEKIHQIDNHIICLASGMTADTLQLIKECRSRAAQYRLQHQEGIPVELMVSQLCDIKQLYTQVGGARPWGTSFIFAGYDKNLGLQLYETDPGGTFDAFKIAVIGKSSEILEEISKYLENNQFNSLKSTAAEIARILKKYEDGAIEMATIKIDADGNLISNILESTYVERDKSASKKF